MTTATAAVPRHTARTGLIILAMLATAALWVGGIYLWAADSSPIQGTHLFYLDLPVFALPVAATFATWILWGRRTQ